MRRARRHGRRTALLRHVARDAATPKKRPLASGLLRRLRPPPPGIPPVGPESQWISSRFVGAGVRFGSVSVSTPFS